MAAPTFELADLATRSWHPRIRKYAASALRKEVVSPDHAPVEVIKSPLLAVPDPTCGFAGVPLAVAKDVRFAEVLQLAAEQSAPPDSEASSSFQDDLSAFETTPSGLVSLGSAAMDALDRLAARSPSSLLPLAAGTAWPQAIDPSFRVLLEEEVREMDRFETAVLGLDSGLPGSDSSDAESLDAKSSSTSPMQTVGQFKGSALGKRKRALPLPHTS